MKYLDSGFKRRGASNKQASNIVKIPKTLRVELFNSIYKADI